MGVAPAWYKNSSLSVDHLTIAGGQHVSPVLHDLDALGDALRKPNVVLIGKNDVVAFRKAPLCAELRSGRFAAGKLIDSII